MQANTEKLVSLLRTLSLTESQLAELSALSAFPTSAVPLLSGAAAILNDHRMAASISPSTHAYTNLFELLVAVASSPMATQSGGSAYTLLSPVVHALNDVAELAVSVPEHWQAFHNLTRLTLLQPGQILWERAVTAARSLSDVNSALPRASFLAEIPVTPPRILLIFIS